MATIVQLSAKRSGVINVCEQCPERAYLQLKVPEDISRIKSLTFTIVSHDQGWSDDEERFKGTYEFAFSYFEAYITTPTGHDRTRPRTLQSNRHAMPEPFRHIIRWNLEDSPQDIQAWLRSIQGGDYVQVVPQAHHQGWKNHVHEMQIEATGTEVLDPYSPLSNTLSPMNPTGFGFHGTLNNARREIRLLKLKPSNNDENLSCEIYHASLLASDIPSYETISYCWGGPSEPDEIFVSPFHDSSDTQPARSGFGMRIRRNLSSALRRLRPSQGDGRMLWVDAICIDQNNLSERAEQVLLMKEIYKKASGTIVWLGEEREEDQDEVQNLLMATQIAEIYSNKEGWEYDDPKPLHAPLKRQPDHFSGSDCPVFERAWFRRSWVVQEVVYSKAVSVQLGPHAFPWPLLLRMNRCISRSAWRPASIRRALMPALFNILFDADSCTGNVYLMRDTNPTIKAPVDVLDVVVQGADLDATDPRDKIFALVGLDLTRVAGRPDVRIQPDYTKGIGRVFADFTRWWIAEHKSLRILSAIHVSVGRTWQQMSMDKVDAEGRTSWSFWSDGKSVWSRSTLGLWRSSRYRASANTTVDISLVNNDTNFNRLRLKGGKVSTIKAINRFPYFQCLFQEDLTPLRRVYEKLLEPTNLRRTWTPEASLHDLDTNTAAELKADDGAIGNHFQTHRPYAIQHDGAIECHPSIYFTTEHGVQGLCPPMASPGDIVVVLYGGNVPYILREMPSSSRSQSENSGKQYSLVGECYLEKHMHGLTIQQIRDSAHSRAEETFDIL